MASRLHRLLAGEDGPGRRALPLGELLHPAPLLATVVLVVNDHVLKGSGWLPGLITGKLSDFAGLLFFPLLLTAAGDLLLLGAARLSRAPIDFSLRRWKLAAACGLTTALFGAVKLSPAAADAVAELLGALGVPSRIVADPTDLVALPMIGVAYWLGQREIARVPLGRLEAVERIWHAGQRGEAVTAFDDVAQLGASSAETDALASGFVLYLETGDATDAERALRSIRAPRGARASPPRGPPSARTRTARPTDDSDS